MVVKKSAPRPYEITRELASIRQKVIERMIDRYRVAFSMVHRRRRGEISESRRTGHSDPTGDAVAENERLVAKLVWVGNKVHEVCAGIDGIDRVLSELTGDSKDNERVRHRPGEVPMVPLDGLEELRRARNKKTRQNGGRKNLDA